MSKENEKKLERELEDAKFLGVNARIEANYNIINSKIDSNHNLLNQKINGNQRLLVEKLDNILCQTTKTNGRVTTIEDEYVDKKVVKKLEKKIDDYTEKFKIIAIISDYPKASILAVIGFLVLVQLDNIINILKFIF